MQSTLSGQLDQIQASLASALKSIGFRRKGRTFNRSTEDGVVQVINLQSGQPPIGEERPLPPGMANFRPDLHGRFTVNLGVHVKEIWEQESDRPHPSFIQDYHCHIRTRLGRLVQRQDYWWPLDSPTSPAIDDVRYLLLGEGVGFLERFGKRQTILAGWISMNDGPDRLTARARVDVAVIAARGGDAASAARLLIEQIDQTSQQGHIDYVRRLARNLDLDI